MPTSERCARLSKIVAYSSIILLGIAIVAVTILSLLPNYSSYSDSCPGIPDSPYGISFTHYGDGVVKVSWNEPWSSRYCGITYSLMVVYEDTEIYYATADNFLMLDSLHGCSVLAVRIWSISDWGYYSTYYIEEQFDMTPPNQQISEIYTEEWGDSLSLTWYKPQNLSRCQVIYYIEYSSQFADDTSYIEDPQFIIPFNKYCFRIKYQITVLVNSEVNSITSRDYNANADIKEYGFQISTEDPEEFIFTWDSHPKEKMCSLQYRVSYITINSEPAIVTTTDPKARFNFVYCQAAWITMNVIASNGDITDTTIGSLGATLAPKNITDVNEINIDMDSSENAMIITWEYPQLALDCYVRYYVNITTDSGTFTYMEVVPPIIFSKDLHCVSLELEFGVTVLGIPYKTYFTVKYDIVPDAVENFIVNRTTDSELVASWDPHPKENQCPLLYRIVRIINGDELEPVETELNSYMFEFTYCVDTQLRITAFIGDHESESVSIDATQFTPTAIGDVQNIEINSISGMINIAWNPPLHVDECALIYTVTDIHPDTDSTDTILCEPSNLRSCSVPKYCNTNTNTISIEILTEILGTNVTGTTSTTTNNCTNAVTTRY